MRIEALLALSLLSAAPLQAEVRLPAVFGDHMVLQAEREAPVWGWAEPGEDVRVRGSWSTREVSARAGADGRFACTLSTPVAGGPHTLTVSGSNELVIEDVLVGEVWLCSGQSNMEMSVSGKPPGTFGVEDEAAELAAADFPDIRLFLVQNAIAPAPLDECKGEWKRCSPETVAAFSAAGYFFGRELHRELGVPVGLIAADWGGTVVESWTSREGLAPFDELAGELARTARLAADPTSLDGAQDAARARFWEQVAARDPLSAAGAQDPGFDDAEWETMALPGLWEDAGIGAVDGVVWFRREVQVPQQFAGRTLTLQLGGIDDMDTTWFNGERVGGLERDGMWRTPREYTIPAALAREGRAVIAVRVLDTGGAGGFNGEPDSMRLRVADSLTEPLALSGEWRVRAGASLGDLPRWPRQQAFHANTPTALYNGMIAPLVPFALRGAIWYQGESNRTRARQYRALFPAMIEDWRAKWGSGDFPFYYVQIAPFAYGGDTGQAAELRDAQRLTLALPNTGMAVTMDVGNPRDIHPKKKREVGQRLAYWALAKTYGRERAYSGPLYAGVMIEGDALRVLFDHADGLATTGGAPTHFEVAGPDGRFVPAEARIDGSSVVVRSAQVAKPVAARYGWGAADEPNLVNGAGLPASSFTTED